MDRTTELLANCAWMLGFDRVINLCHLLFQTESVAGAIVEFGTAKGTTAMLMTHLSRRRVYVYDSFEGLPEIPAGERVHPGWKKGTFAYPVDDLLLGFQKYDLPPPVIHKGWFKDVPAECLPPRISFAHLDGDLYESTYDALSKVYDRLARGAVCVIDDYGWELAQGVEAACLDFLHDKPEEIIPLCTRPGQGSHACFMKE